MIKEAFYNRYNLDKKKYIKKSPWLTTWEISQHYHKYHGPEDFIQWFGWSTKHKYPHYFPQEQITPLVDISHLYHQKLINRLSLKADVIDYRELSVYNAQDYLFQNLYPVPERLKINRILDFGAGFGRQANLWTQLRKDIVYVGMDAIEGPYCLQYLYYNHLDFPFYDYVFEKSVFLIKDEPGIYHLPTWRADILQKSFFDLVVCVQVLQELNARLVRNMIKVFMIS